MAGTGFITSLFAFAIGAILHFAVADKVSGVDLAMIGVIIMVAAAVGLVASIAAWLSERNRRVEGAVVEREIHHR